jgi:hypothetical protein
MRCPGVAAILKALAHPFVVIGVVILVAVLGGVPLPPAGPHHAHHVFTVLYYNTIAVVVVVVVVVVVKVKFALKQTMQVQRKSSVIAILFI